MPDKIKTYSKVKPYIPVSEPEEQTNPYSIFLANQLADYHPYVPPPPQSYRGRDINLPDESRGIGPSPRILEANMTKKKMVRK